MLAHGKVAPKFSTCEVGSEFFHVLGVLEPYAPLRLNVGWT